MTITIGYQGKDYAVFGSDKLHQNALAHALCKWNRDSSGTKITTSLDESYVFCFFSQF